MPRYLHPALVVADGWADYELLATGDGMKKERWGRFVLVRPDPQALWPHTPAGGPDGWGDDVDAFYRRSSDGGGRWDVRRKLPEAWTVGWHGLSFRIRPTAFKHTGLFPEQAANWAWMQERLRAWTAADDRTRRSNEPAATPRVLNLFGYTGAATVACAAVGAAVTHVDAAKGMVAWCRDNAEASGLADAPIRYLVDDVVKFAERERRRGSRYEGILLDPPVYGRGKDGQMWRIEADLAPLLAVLKDLLADRAAFFLLNTYTAGLSPVAAGNLVQDALAGRGGALSVGEIGLPVLREDRVLPCGVFARWNGDAA